MNKQGRSRRVDRSIVKRLRRNGWTIKRIAVQMHCCAYTVQEASKCTLPVLVKANQDQSP